MNNYVEIFTEMPINRKNWRFANGLRRKSMGGIYRGKNAIKCLKTLLKQITPLQ